MRIKICGLFRDEDMRIVNELKPDFVGFVFAKSKRKVSYEKAKELAKALIIGNDYNTPVGVFVNEDTDFIAKLYDEGIIKFAQLHGDEPLSYVNELKEKAKGIKIIKALKLETEISMGACAWNSGIAEPLDYLLLDNKTPGSGESFDWSLLKNFEIIKKRIFLAGGINISNMDEAMKFDPFCIDVSSGVEKDGVKNFDKIKELIGKVRA